MTITFHEVSPGDTIYSIARMYDVYPTGVQRSDRDECPCHPLIGPNATTLHVGELLEIRSYPALYIIEEEPW